MVKVLLTWMGHHNLSKFSTRHVTSLNGTPKHRKVVMPSAQVVEQLHFSD